MDRKVVRIFKKKPFILQIIGISTINSALIPENCRRFIEDYRTQHLAARTGKTQKTILSGNEYSERELGANG